MLKKTITYQDLDGNPVTEDFYFNLSKAEIAEMELSHKGGLEAYIQEIIQAEDGGAIISAFKEIIGSAIGRRSEDNRRFVKNQEIRDDFFQSDAWSTLFMDILSKGDEAASFVKSIVPKDLAENFDKLETVELPGEAKDDRPAYIREDRDPTKAELQAMSKDELMEAMRRKNARS
jgi:hypothetical protein